MLSSMGTPFSLSFVRTKPLAWTSQVQELFHPYENIHYPKANVPVKIILHILGQVHVEHYKVMNMAPGEGTLGEAGI